MIILNWKYDQINVTHWVLYLKTTCISSYILRRFSNYLVFHLLNLYKLLEDNFANSIQVRIYTVWHKRYVKFQFYLGVLYKNILLTLVFTSIIF